MAATNSASPHELHSAARVIAAGRINNKVRMSRRKRMVIDNGARRHARRGDGVSLDPSEIVMGLHWDPPQEDAVAEPDDLDALCVLLAAQGGVVEVIHPGHPRNLDGSVVHTGDSRTGASA